MTNNGNLSTDLVPFDFDPNRRPSNRFVEVEHTVLAPETISPIKLYYFHGSEEEDFGSLEESLNDFFGTKKMEDDKQRLSYLRSFLKGIARIDFMKKYPDIDNLKYVDVINALRTKYSGSKNMIKKMEAFEETAQFVGESPANFFVRVSEMAARAKVTDETAIFRRFRHGLLPYYFNHCQALSADSHAEFYKFSQGLWKNQTQNRLQGTNYAITEHGVANVVPKAIEKKQERIPEEVPFNIENLKSMIEDVIERKIKSMRVNDTAQRTREPYQYNRYNNRYQEGNRNRDSYSFRNNGRYENRNPQGQTNDGRYYNYQNQGISPYHDRNNQYSQDRGSNRPDAYTGSPHKQSNFNYAEGQDQYNDACEQEYSKNS
ncbi:hypothetical protein BD560DRAFT_426780 [Blakeslea trispora]|nr:hypothetical protein BD560DRAFT_426780 [Blakeslea trispora]